MIVIVCILLCVGGIFLYSCIEKRGLSGKVDILIVGFSFILSIVTGFISIIMLIVILFSYAGLDATIAENEVKREALVYQLENEVYENDNDLGKRELYEDIIDWNISLARVKALNDNFWVGVFYPDALAEFDYIELK